jgi:hypothetical protein
MNLIAQGNRQIEQLGGYSGSDSNSLQRTDTTSVIASRLFNSAARMISASQEGLLTLRRLRTGGAQTINVHQHVSVADGGQAVVAGQIGGGRKRGRSSKNG